jgi:hypothetical protein
MTLESHSTGENSAADTWRDTVRERLLEVWGEQSCQRAKHWPQVRERLIEKLGPLIAESIAELARLFDGGGPVGDPAIAVWQAFPRLDRQHCAILATLLIGAQMANRARQP